VSRRLDFETQSMDAQVPVPGGGAQVAIAVREAPLPAIAEEAEIELAGLARAGAAVDVGDRVVGLTLTAAAGTPVGWSELDEWLEAS
jgi:hypothetical protein